MAMNRIKKHYKIVVNQLHGEDRYYIVSPNGKNICICWSKKSAYDICKLLNTNKKGG